MGLNRRNYLKTLGVAFGSLSATKAFGSTSKKKEEEKEFYAMLYDSTYCAGCQNCEYVCAEHYGLPVPEDYPEPGVKRKTTEEQRIVLNCVDTPDGEVYMRHACNHCNSPACASACLTKAMVKTDEGPVIWREDKCMGCRSCMIACPFDIPKFEYQSANPKIQKCRMCFEKMQEGEVPVCVENCPGEAILFGKRRDLLEIARERIYQNPGSYHPKIYGEHEAGGTGVLYLSAVPFEEFGFRNDLGTVAYPEYNKTFLYSVPAVLVLWPAFLLGLHNATKDKTNLSTNK